MIRQTTFYLVEQIDNLGENVEASSWIYWRLIEDTRLETRTESFLISVIYVIFFPFMFRLYWLIEVQNLSESNKRRLHLLQHGTLLQMLEWVGPTSYMLQQKHV